MFNNRLRAQAFGVAVIVLMISGCSSQKATNMRKFNAAAGRYTSVAMDIGHYRHDHPEFRGDPLVNSEGETYQLLEIARIKGYDPQSVDDFDRSATALELSAVSKGVKGYAYRPVSTN